MNKLYAFLFAFLYLHPADAQTPAFQAQSEAGKPYLSHKVAPKENWYSVGRMFNISPREIAAFNKVTIDKGLAIGQSIRIPLSAANFIQQGQPEADEAAIPLYHTVNDKEGLYRISQLYNKVPVESIRTWNKLKSDEVSNGQQLVVGYLRVKKELSPLAGGGQQNIIAPVVTQPAAKPAVSAEKKTEAPPPVVKEQQQPVNKPPVQETSKTDKPQPPAAKPAQDKQAEKTVQPAAAGQQSAQKNTSARIGTGAFKDQFDEQVGRIQDLTLETGEGAIFKSTSGWKDGKYYALMNKAVPGTIVKVHNPANNKIIYAKVLGEIPPGKESEGLLIRISNAAAAELQLAEGRTNLDVSWAK